MQREILCVNFHGSLWKGQCSTEDVACGGGFLQISASSPCGSSWLFGACCPGDKALEVMPSNWDCNWQAYDSKLLILIIRWEEKCFTDLLKIVIVFGQWNKSELETCIFAEIIMCMLCIITGAGFTNALKVYCVHTLDNHTIIHLGSSKTDNKW